jgi:peptidoglycan/xylan/chitin deacetylase (PgdA/CDA1 family)
VKLLHAVEIGAAAGIAAAWAVRGRSSSVFAPSVFHGPPDKRSVALTFDDGPTSSTPRLLELLARYGIRATFFQCGVQVRRNPEIAREVYEAGHEIGNHTDTHPLLPLNSTASILHEIDQAQQSIYEATGAVPTLFRAPYGARWFGLRAAQERRGLLGVMWTTIGLDWKLDSGSISQRILKGARNGAIYCLHDGRGLAENPDITSTLKAVERAVPALLERGFRFETVSELLCLKT